LPIEIPVELLPVPKTLFEFTFALIGWQLAHSFGTRLDEELLEQISQIKDGAYLNAETKKAIRLFIERLLDFVHHAWIGLLGVVYFGSPPILQSIPIPTWIPLHPCAELFWLCYGMTVEDAQHHIRSYASRKVNEFKGRTKADALPPVPSGGVT